MSLISWAGRPGGTGTAAPAFICSCPCSHGQAVPRARALQHLLAHAHVPDLMGRPSCGHERCSTCLPAGRGLPASPVINPLQHAAHDVFSMRELRSPAQPPLHCTPCSALHAAALCCAPCSALPGSSNRPPCAVLCRFRMQCSASSWPSGRGTSSGGVPQPCAAATLQRLMMGLTSAGHLQHGPRESESADLTGGQQPDQLQCAKSTSASSTHSCMPLQLSPLWSCSCVISGVAAPSAGKHCSIPAACWILRTRC